MTAKVPVRNPWVLPPPPPAAPAGPAIASEGPVEPLAGTLATPVLAAAPASPTRRKQVPRREEAPSPKDPGRRPFTIYLDPPDFALLERERQRRALGSGPRRGYAEYSAIISSALRAYLSIQS